MLLPSPDTVAALIREIPSGKVVTLEALRAELARRHRVEAVCPFQTKQALRAIADRPRAIPFWRIVARNGELLKYLPGGVKKHAALLTEEQVPLERTAKGKRVKRLKEFLQKFAP